MWRFFQNFTDLRSVYAWHPSLCYFPPWRPNPGATELCSAHALRSFRFHQAAHSKGVVVLAGHVCSHPPDSDVGFGVLGIELCLSQLWAAIIEYHRLGGLNSKHLFLPVLEIGSVRSRCQHGQVHKGCGSALETSDQVILNLLFTITFWYFP